MLALPARIVNFAVRRTIWTPDMTFASLDDFLKDGRPLLAKGPVALILIEDDVEILSTLRHHVRAGFRAVLAATPISLDLPEDLAEAVHQVTYDTLADNALTVLVNKVIAACPETTWVYYCYNGEYLFHPFCETRSIGEMIAFHTEERRDAALAYVIDLYAPDLAKNPDAVNLKEAMLDRSGYYAQARPDANGHPKERQLDFFGGVRWRFEEHIPKARRKIDRIALFRAQPGLKLRPDHTFNIEEYNTYSCPWHHNITLSIASFRTAKALKNNAGSTFDIPTFAWRNSVRFEWNSQQLMDLGLMEPGQWF